MALELTSKLSTPGIVLIFCTPTLYASFGVNPGEYLLPSLPTNPIGETPFVLEIACPVSPPADPFTDAIEFFTESIFFEFQKIISAFFKIDKIYLQLYPPTKSKWKGILNLNKNLKMNDAISAPQLWDPKIIPTKELGKKRNGYQIIQCSK